MEYGLSLIIGISLSATSGFRIFVPLFVISIAALAGWIELTPAFDWLGTYPALIALAVAALLELIAYLFPYVDNLLSTIAVPISLVAGTLITYAVLVDFPPFLAWALAIIAGGGAALGGSTLSSAVHAGSTIASAGTVNPVISFLESLISIILSFIAVLLPILALLLIMLIVWFIARFFRRGRKRKDSVTC